MIFTFLLKPLALLALVSPSEVWGDLENEQIKITLTVMETSRDVTMIGIDSVELHFEDQTIKLSKSTSLGQTEDFPRANGIHFRKGRKGLSSARFIFDVKGYSFNNLQNIKLSLNIFSYNRQKIIKTSRKVEYNLDVDWH